MIGAEAAGFLGWSIGLGGLGLIVGSFVSLISFRAPRGFGLGRELVWGRSKCPQCGQSLRAWELAPIVSFLLLRGRCGRCRHAISLRYPLIEGACLLVGLWAGAAQPGLSGLVAAALGWTLVLIAVLDFEFLWLPLPLSLAVGASGLIQAGVFAPDALIDRAIGAAAGFLSLALVASLYRRLRAREGMGGGDPILFGAAGAWVGWIGLPSVLLWASVGALSLVAAQALLGRRPAGDQKLAFGAFLALGLWMTWMLGPLTPPMG